MPCATAEPQTMALPMAGNIQKAGRGRSPPRSTPNMAGGKRQQSDEDDRMGRGDVLQAPAPSAAGKPSDATERDDGKRNDIAANGSLLLKGE